MGIFRLNSRIEEAKRLLDFYEDELSKAEDSEDFNSRLGKVITDIRASLYEEISSIDMGTIEDLSNPPIATVHDSSIYPRSLFMADWDGSAAKDSATQYLAKLIAEKNEGKKGKSIDDLRRDLKSVGESRGRFSSFLLNAKPARPFFQKLKEYLWEVKSKWQDFFSIHTSMHIEDYTDVSIDFNREILSRPDRYLQDGFLELVHIADSLNIQTSIASQNQFPLIAPMTYPFGCDITIANNVMIKDGKVYLPRSGDKKLDIITAADKHGFFRRLRRYIEDRKLRPEIRKADFFDAEAEGFLSTFHGNHYTHPRFGLERSFLFESEAELGGDVLQTLKGLLKPEDIDTAYLVRSEGTFDSTTTLGKRVIDSDRIKTDLQFVDNAREAALILQSRLIPSFENYALRGFIGHTRIVEEFHDYKKGSKTIEELIEILPTNDRDLEKLKRGQLERIRALRLDEDSVKEMVRSRERALWLLQEISKLSKGMGHETRLEDLERELDAPMEVDWTFPLIGTTYKIDEKNIKEKFLGNLENAADLSLRLMDDTTPTNGTREVIRHRDRKVRNLDEKEKSRFVQN